VAEDRLLSLGFVRVADRAAHVGGDFALPVEPALALGCRRWNPAHGQRGGPAAEERRVLGRFEGAFGGVRLVVQPDAEGSG
jgi:hypothetical protein